MKKSIIHIVFLMACIAIFAAVPVRAAEKPFKIGVILPLTGPLGYLGEEEKNAIILAEEHINKKSRVMKVIFDDSKGKPSEAATVANKMIEFDEVDALVTATTSVSRAVLPIADRNKRILVALCMDPTIQKDSPNAFRFYEGMGQEAETLLSYFTSKENRKKRVGILYVNHAGTVQQLRDYFIPGFDKLGVKIVYQEPYELTEKDFKVKIDKARHAKIDSLIIIGFGFEYMPIFKQLAQYGLVGNLEIAGGWGFIAPNKVPSELLENVVVAAPTYIFEKNEKARLFEEEYVKRFGKAPNFDAAFAYDAISIVAEGLTMAKGDREKAREILSKMGTYNGIMGQVEIDKDGDMKVPMGLGIFKSGNIERLK